MLFVAGTLAVTMLSQEMRSGGSCSIIPCSPPWCRRRACQPAPSVTILHAAIALPLSGAGHAAAAIPNRRDAAAGRSSAGDLTAFVSVGLLLRDGWSRQQRQHGREGERPLNLHCGGRQVPFFPHRFVIPAAST